MVCLRFVAVLSVIFASGACGSETTAFRPTDKADDNDHAGPPGAVYDVEIDGLSVAQVRVWSSGGYISATDQPATHLGFEIHNAGARPLVFDTRALELTVFDVGRAALAPTRLTTMAPLGPAEITVAPHATIVRAAYFRIPVRPRGIDTMRLRWSVRYGDERYLQVTSFVRDDDGPVIEHPTLIDAAAPRS